MFQAHWASASGAVLFRKKLRRDQVLTFLAGLPHCLLAMEACASAHHWGRPIGELAHEVRLISPQYVRPYVKAQKNDDRDAEAIAEAATRRRCGSWRSRPRRNSTCSPDPGLRAGSRQRLLQHVGPNALKVARCAQLHAVVSFAVGESLDPIVCYNHATIAGEYVQAWPAQTAVQAAAPSLSRVTGPSITIENQVRGATGGNDPAVLRDATVPAGPL